MSDEDPRVEVSDQRPPGSSPLDLERLRAIACEALAGEGEDGVGLSVSVVDDAQMAELHVQYLGVEGPTDVLSFPLDDDDDPEGPEPLLGEVVVSVDTAAREASERGISTDEELLRYVVHGTLHLLGYDDHDPADRERMWARQEALVAGFRGRFPGPGA